MAEIEVVWATAADRDLGRALVYLGRRSPKASSKLAKQVIDGVQRIQTFPLGGQIAEELSPEGRYRRLVIRPYTLFYRYDETAGRVAILRFWDTRRDPASLTVEDSAS